MVTDTKSAIIDIIKGIKHPAIDKTLWDLGMIKEPLIEDKKIEITLVFPHPEVPIKDEITNSVKDALKGIGLHINIKYATMDDDELERFMSLEQQHWKGM